MGGRRINLEYRNLGRSGLKVSPLCLGTMMFGGPTDETTSDRIIARARAVGINFIDTADAYNSGRSEEVVGRAIGPERSWWILATKLANPTSDSPNDRGLSRRRTFDAVEASLRRLGTDVIDILYLHKEDQTTPLDETVHALADLLRQGKIRYFGVSNFRAWRVAEICRLCDLAGIDRPVVSQPYYNLLNRMPEVEHLPACAHYGLGVAPYSPLARGVLTGKYAADGAPAEDTRAGRQDKRIMETEELLRASLPSPGCLITGSLRLRLPALERSHNGRTTSLHSIMISPRKTKPWWIGSLSRVTPPHRDTMIQYTRSKDALRLLQPRIEPQPR